jgi:2-haloacid dehalogenase
MPANIESRAVGERWATFDCYGTLVDWEGGFRSAFSELWPDADPHRLLEHYHAVEPRVQAGRDLAYREVMARSLAALAAIDGLEVPAGRRDTLGESLPGWRPFAEVPASLREVRERGWRLAALSNTDPDLLAASLAALGAPFDLTITAADAGSYKPAPGHWEAFRARAGEINAHVHVAASIFHDIAPCARMGLPAIWINRLGESSDLPRAGELPDLDGLADALARVG